MISRIFNIIAAGIAILLPLQDSAYSIAMLSALLILPKFPLDGRLIHDFLRYLILALLFAAPLKEYQNTISTCILASVLTFKESKDEWVVIVLTITGGWLGAFLLPLDWQEDYLIYPRPIVKALLVGNVLGNIISIGKRNKGASMNH